MWRPFLIILFAELHNYQQSTPNSTVTLGRVQCNSICGAMEWQRTSMSLTIYLITNSHVSHSDIFAPQLHCDWNVWVSKVGWSWCGLWSVREGLLWAPSLCVPDQNLAWVVRVGQNSSMHKQNCTGRYLWRRYERAETHWHPSCFWLLLLFSWGVSLAFPMQCIGRNLEFYFVTIKT